MVYFVVRTLLSVMFRLVWRPVIEGVEHIPPTGPVILASNHLSFIDSVVIPLAVPRRVTFLAKAEYFTGRGLRGRVSATFFSSIGAVPVHRGGTRDETTAALEAAQQILAEGGAFGIYPEGTRSLDGRLFRFRTGVAWLGLATRAPIVPVAVVGTNRVLPVGARIPRVSRVVVRFAPAIDTSGPAQKLEADGGKGAGRVRRELADEVMSAVAARSEQQPAGRYNDHSAESAR
jgi:1-acyl-sn-glycerol-3-phosphate acyltransferase